MPTKIKQKSPEYWQEAIKHLSKQDKILAGIIKNYHGEFMTGRGDTYFTLARAIVGQQISVKAADAIWKRFDALTKSKPQNVLKLSDEELRSVGLSMQKVKYLRSIAEFSITHNGKWHEEDEEVIKELIKIKGVGRWTAEMFLMFGLLRADVLPLGDLGLLKAFEKHYNKPRDKLTAHARKWQPYRSVATWYLWRSLDPVPVEY